jgi:hypothetical protein
MNIKSHGLAGFIAAIFFPAAGFQLAVQTD